MKHLEWCRFETLNITFEKFTWSGPYPEIFWGDRFLKWKFFLTDTMVAWDKKFTSF